MHRRRTILPALTVAAIAATAARPASAALGHWGWSVQSGCARDIAVGPNDVPWIIGCDNGVRATGPGSVFYLQRGDLTPHWTYDNYKGINIAVSLTGAPFVTVAGVNFGFWDMPTGWIATDTGVVTNGLSEPAGQWQFAANGTTGPFAVGVLINTQVPAGEEGYPSPPEEETLVGLLQYNSIWGANCGSSNCNTQGIDAMGPLEMTTSQVTATPEVNSVYVGTSNLPWSPLGASEMVKSVAVFTDPPNGGTLANGQNTVQVPWALDLFGNVVFWNGQGWQVAPFPGGVRDLPTATLTDHYYSDGAGGLWVWNGTADGGGNATWSEIIASGGGPTMRRLAYSQAASGSFVGQSAPIGPSQVWAIDYGGYIYTLEWIPPIILQ